MKILITGATGFIGKNLICTLKKKQYKVFALTRKSSDITFLKQKGVQFHVDDGSTENLNEYFTKNQIEGVIHLASCFIAQHKPEDIGQIFQSNLLFATRLLESTIDSPVKWFINTGTAWQHYNNHDGYSPVNLYAATKEAFEIISQYYTSVSHLLFTTIKICDTYGNGDTRKKLMNIWCDAIKQDISIDMSPGYQKIDIVHISDVSKAYLALIQTVKGGDKRALQNKSFVVTSGNPITLRELSKIFESVTSQKLKINWGAKEYRTREVMTPWNKGSRIPSWIREIGLEEGIRKLTEELL